MTAQPIAAPGLTGRFAAIYPYILLALCMLFWSGNWIIGRALRDTMPPIALTFWRWVVAALILAPIALPRLKAKLPLLRRSWLLLLGLAVTGGALNQVAAYFALRHTEAVNAVLLNAASPLFILIASWIFDRERTNPRQILGMLMSIGGVLVIMNRGDPRLLLGLRFSIGDLALIGVMPLWAIYTIMLRRRPREIDNIELIFLIGIFGLATLGPAYALERLYIPPAPLSWEVVGAALYMGAFASVGAYLCWNKGAELVGSNRAGSTTYLMPAFTAALAVLILGEEVHPFHAVGVSMILFGIWLATSARRAIVANRVEPV